MNHAYWMQKALEEAFQAGEKGEVPVGAVVVAGGKLAAAAHNLKETLRDPTAHAEMLALRRAARAAGGWRLEGHTLYVTLEPCPMCAGALVQARVSTLVYGAEDPKAGAAGTVMDLVRCPYLNHQVQVIPGVLAEECSRLLKDFFHRLRPEK